MAVMKPDCRQNSLKAYAATKTTPPYFFHAHMVYPTLQVRDGGVADVLCTALLGSFDFIAHAVEPLEVLALQALFLEGECFLGELERQALRESGTFFLECGINITSGIKVAGVPHAVIGYPKAIDQTLA